MAVLTREQMAAVIEGGGSVLHNGALITRLADLPSAAELAAGDPAKEAAAQAALQAQIAALQSQVDQLQVSQVKALATGTGTGTEEPPKGPAPKGSKG